MSEKKFRSRRYVEMDWCYRLRVYDGRDGQLLGGFLTHREFWLYMAGENPSTYNMMSPEDVAIWDQQWEDRELTEANRLRMVEEAREAAQEKHRQQLTWPTQPTPKSRPRHVFTRDILDIEIEDL